MRNCLGEFDAAALEIELAKSWGFILNAGVLNFIGGFLALCSPTAASDMIIAIIAGAMIVVGFINMCGVCFAEKTHRHVIFLSGLLVFLLGILMLTHVATSLVVVTSLIAALYLCEGLFRTALAFCYRDIPGRMYGLISGLCSIILSVLILSTMPASSAYTLGVLLGTNWVVYGLNRIALAMLGRGVANSLVDNGSNNSDTSLPSKPTANISGVI